MDTHGRQYTTVELGLDADGTFRALRTTTIGEIGAYCGTVGLLQRLAVRPVPRGRLRLQDYALSGSCGF